MGGRGSSSGSRGQRLMSAAENNRLTTREAFAALDRAEMEDEEAYAATGIRPRYRVPASSVEVRTSRYEFAHGTEPRGYGTWTFVADGTSYFDSPDTTFQYTGQHGSAKRAAKKWAGDRGEYSVILES